MTPPAAAASAAPRGRVAVPPRPRVAPPRPRRISGPVRPSVRPPARPAPAVSTPVERGLVLGLLDALGSLASHGAIDRLIRGRVWIAVIASALIGIVTLQLLVLQLNANIGRSLVREAQLQRGNAALSIEDSELAGGERVESKAAHLGMQLVPAGSLRFLTSYPPADVARAAAALNTPVHGTTAGTNAGSTSGSGESTAGTESASTATNAAGTDSAGASGEQAPSGEQSASTEQAPAGEATAPAPATTQAAATTGSEAPSTGEAGAPTSAPTTAAGGTEPTGAG